MVEQSFKYVKMNLLAYTVSFAFAGMRAPPISELKEFLMKNPTYEIIRPSRVSLKEHLEARTAEQQHEKPATVPAAKPAPQTKAISSRTQLIKAKTNEILASKGEAAQLAGGQTSMKQFLMRKQQSANEDGPAAKIKIKRSLDGSVVAVTKDGQVRTMVVGAKTKELDAKMREKQRQIKLIPLQPLSKPVSTRMLTHLNG